MPWRGCGVRWPAKRCSRNQTKRPIRFPQMKALLLGAGLGTVFALQASGATTGPPVVVLATALTAAPNSLSSGNAGPLNRQVFELTGFAATDPRAQVLCVYPKLVYRCHSEREPTNGGGRQRVVVTIPDLDLG